jgi:hypothetical protein
VAPLLAVAAPLLAVAALSPARRRGAVAVGDQIARIQTPRDRLRGGMTSLFALREREPAIKPSRGSITAG